jgi:peptidoglycan hydrolase-like protein with peptidoglycan-binding domain
MTSNPECPRRFRHARFQDVNRCLLTLAVFTACGVILARTDDNMVTVQNRLKAGGFYFGNPTGLLDSETAAALTRYQIRHGLTVTGKLDAPTAKELNASAPKTQSTPRALTGSWRRLRSGEMQFVEQQQPPPTPWPSAATRVVFSPPAAAPPAEGPAASPSVAGNPPPKTAPLPANLKQPRGSLSGADTVNPDNLRDYVEAFVQAGLARPQGGEIKFFAESVDYFGRPNVPREQIQRDLVRYNQKWPHRRFWIDGDIQFQEQSGSGIKLLFPLRYELRNGARHTSGKVLKSLTLLKTANNELQIVAVNE